MSNLSQIKKNHFGCLVVGGGIVGAGILRDLALHGVTTLLIDKKCFSSQTSQSSSKMLHGGIRYLENMDIKLVYEALHEKNFWLKNAPDLCREEAFYLPIYDNSKRPLWQVKIGLAAYDFLSAFKNSKHKILTKEETLKALPGIKESGLKGAGIYYDAIVDDKKMTLRVIESALKNDCAKALEEIEITSVKRENDLIHCTLMCTVTKQTKEISCKELIFATGPFTDKLMKNFPKLGWRECLLPNKGSHLWIDASKLPIENPMVLNTKDNRIIFVIPHGEKVLVGTTEKTIEGDFFDLKPDQDEINYLLGCLHEYFPHNDITEKDIVGSFAGVRPLVRELGETDLSKTAREHKIVHLKKNIHVVIGGKYTTFRVMASDITKKITPKFGVDYHFDFSKRPL